MSKEMTMSGSAKDYIRSDCYRYTGQFSDGAILKRYFQDKTFRWQVAFRMVNGKGFTKLVGIVLWKFNGMRSRIIISRQTKIGYGLFIGHGGPIVVNPTTVIGNNVNLSQFTTIGSNFDNAAVIEDDVYVGPSVCIIENVHIGKNATIGAGSVVTKDIPENATAAGNYAKVLNYENPGRFVHNRWGE